MNTILVINTGSTSTKVAIFKDKECVIQNNLTMPEDLLKACKKTVEQLPYRTELVLNWLKENGYQITDLDGIAARGGALPPIQDGAYRVNQLMLDVLTYAPSSIHESALASMIGNKVSGDSGVPVFIFDGGTVDEMKKRAKYTGMPNIKNRSGAHVLNSKRVSRIIAEKLGKTYRESTFIVIHLGGSITVTAHDKGKIVDSSSAFRGPMSVQRAGRIDSDTLIHLCYSGQYTESELIKLMNGGSGFKAYFGTQDARVVSKLLDEGDELAQEVCEALAYQTAKATGEMMIACDNPIDRIIITGGMANFKYVTDYITNKVSAIAPVEVLPGEFEMEALAEGILMVLEGKEEAKEYDILPIRFETREEFYAFVEECKKL